MKPNIIFILLDGSRFDRINSSPEFMELLKKGTVLYLKTSIQTQLERTMNDKERPLLRGKENKEVTLRKMAKLRNPLYEKSSNFIIEETDNSNQTVDNIIKQLNESK